MRLTSIPWLLVLAATIRAEEPVDAWVQHLDGLPASTTDLRLTGEKRGLDGPVFLESDLAKLRRFEAIRRLDLGRAGSRASPAGVGGSRWDLWITDYGLGRLAKLSSLEELVLPDHTDVSEDGLRELAKGLPRLRRLVLRHMGGFGRPNDTTFECLPAFRALEELDLTGCRGGREAEWVGRIATMRKLRSLRLDHCPWARGKALGSLGRIATLRALRLDGATDEDLVAIGTLRALESLTVPRSRGLFSIAGLAPLEALRSLDLRGARKLTDEGLRAVGSLSGLRRLDLRACSKLTDAALAHLAKLPLEEIVLGTEFRGGTPVAEPMRLTDAGLRRLASLRTLRRIELRGVRETLLGPAPKPVQIDVPLAVTDAGLLALTDLPDLEEVVLTHCPKVTAEGEKRFRAKRPGCRLTFPDRLRGLIHLR